MLNKVLKALIEGRLIRTTIKKISIKIDQLISYPAIWLMSRMTHIEDGTILFLTSRGEYDCNAKWICNELLKRKLPYKIYWTYRKGADMSEFPPELNLVVRGSYEFYKAASKARIIVDNSVSLSYLWYMKKKGQVLIETWHGSIGIKRASAESVQDKTWVKRALREGRMTDFCLSNSTFENAVFREDYWKYTPILQLGHARNDILCKRNPEEKTRIRKKIYNKYDLDEDVQICLYAPTYRDDGDMSPYNIDYKALKKALETRFGGKWVIFTRFHFNTLKKLKKLGNYKFEEDVINAGEYPDINELMSCVDVGITDYSSWICDYILTKRPGFLFATDLKDYSSVERGFYYPLETMPFPLATDNDSLICNILSFKDENFEAECEAFIQDKGCIDDGHAAERIADVFEKIMKGEDVSIPECHGVLSEIGV